MTVRVASQRILSAVVPDGVPPPRIVPFDAPWVWLSAGWRDMWQTPALSLIYGAAFAVAAAAMAAGLSWLSLAPAFPVLAGGFLLIGPLVAVGLYEISRCNALGQSVSLGSVVQAGLAARGQLSFFGAALLLIYFFWMQIAALLFMLFLGSSSLPPPSEFMRTLLFTPQGLGLLVAGSVVGAVLATVVFAISCVGVPMLYVRSVDVMTAARASIAAVAANPQAMLLWAGLIVVMMGAGFATLLIGLVLAFPLIGHATWHAYEAIYGQQAP